MSRRAPSPSIRQLRLLASAGALGPHASVRGGPLAAAERDTTLGCATDFDSLVGVRRRDYAAYQLAMQAQPAALRAITDAARRETAAAFDARVGETALARWLAFFRDGHLHLMAAGLAPGGQLPAAQPVERAAPPDPAQSSIVAIDSGVLLLWIPSFDLSYKLVIDSLLAANAARLARSRDSVLRLSRVRPNPRTVAVLIDGRRLPANPVDPDGIAPAVRIPSSIRDDIDYVRGYLNAAR